ncbi:hypothetical protein CDD81_5731 [Ophiocordyceps australis]|uniref:non-specific serine/threonine protein kinase n=1 Tax=Ophiocordyceps australis TaxID=1399860 RepID=A0A2C5Y9A3_9HYPO|nr:hypothetical protein CDD81_5731 [Ophiocordyceps australis]
MADVGARVRSPLAETTNRVLNACPLSEEQSTKTRHDTNVPKTRSRFDTCSSATRAQHAAVSSHSRAVLCPPRPVDEDKRLSQASYASTSSSRSKKTYKTHIGPWQLGRTLGKGSSARVRLCRHSATDQLAAVKIVNRRMAYLVQDSSLAALSKCDKAPTDQSDGDLQVPVAIEREVAILKLIEHPNIMKLYDIWENRSEIYLILEYIDQGDLFTFINSKGRLPEEVAIYFFRQMISAISYCHSFNVCHRDLKPENILITKDLQIKIADFGMAALHQTANHRLATACGSPHYAAPELLKNRQYRGDRADIWSLGVILFAMLSAALPFDDPDLRVMMSRTKKGDYEMPDHLNPDAQDLIHRMLQVNPERRITIEEIWRHPLVAKYSYLDEFGDNSGQYADTRMLFRNSPVPKNIVDPQLLRQLRSLWHLFSEQDLVAKLSCDEPNDQKAFYWLLHSYRNKQLEDFKPELAHSMSDYHHLRPGLWKRSVTCEFRDTESNGHARSVSRFTVISNTADTEAGTDQSYDPYRGSRMLQNCGSEVSQAKIVIHRDLHPVQCASQTGRQRSGSNARRGRTNSASSNAHQVRPNSAKTSLAARQTSRGSLASLRSSRQNAAHPVPPTIRYKRPVNFSHARKRSSSAKTCQKPAARCQRSPSSTGIVGDIRTKKQATAAASESKIVVKKHNARAIGFSAPQPVANVRASVFFNEELRHFSNNCAKDCDEAFKSSLIENDSGGGSWTDGDKACRGSTPLSLTLDGSPTTVTRTTSSPSPTWQYRPLPPLPDHDASLNYIIPAPNGANPRTSSPGILCDESEEMMEVNKVALKVLLPRQSVARVSSAPCHSGPARRLPTLPSIKEYSGVSGGNDVDENLPSLPDSPSQRAKAQNMGLDHLGTIEDTIRVVNSPGGLSPVKAPAPLNVRKKSTTEEFGRRLHRQLAYNAEDYGELASEGQTTDANGRPKKKLATWFKRSPRVGTKDMDDGQHQDAKPTSPSKRAFTFPFWRHSRNRDSDISCQYGTNSAAIGDAGSRDKVSSERGDRGSLTLQESTSGGNRVIEAKQSWFARLFRARPAVRYMCLTVSDKRARREVTRLLREWRRHGIKNIQVDRDRNVVSARVGENHLNIKEVDFFAQTMRVIDHNDMKQQLSIVRFTQERGAASSFHRVVDSMIMFFDSRQLLVMDEVKRQRMLDTLWSN